jgi:hypothetical protein
MKWPFFSSRRNYGLKGCEEKSTKLSEIAAALQFVVGFRYRNGQHDGKETEHG